MQPEKETSRRDAGAPSTSNAGVEDAMPSPSTDGGLDDAADAETGARGIVFRGAQQIGWSPAPTLDFATPPGVQAGDLLLLVLFNSYQSATFASGDAGLDGWQARARVKPTGCGLISTVSILSKRASASEPAHQTVTFDDPTSTYDSVTGILAAWGGVDDVAPIDAENTLTSDTQLTAPSITTTSDGDWLVAAFANNGGTGSAWTPPAGMTQRGSTGLLGLFDQPLGTAGPTGARTVNSTKPACGTVLSLVALRPR